MSETVLDRLIIALDLAAGSDGNVHEPPVAVLWPDKGRQWAGVIEQLRARRRVLTLGPHEPGVGSGPAFWLRCAVAGTVEVAGPDGTPVVYLPGVSRDDMRSVTVDDQLLASLVPLQYRSQWFTQSGGRDWTVRALLANKDRGLALNVAGDESTAQALVAGLELLVREPMARLDGRHIDAAFVNGMLNPDPIRLLLRWIDDPSTLQHELSGVAWNAFADQCRKDFGFDPSMAGAIEAARLLGRGEGAWRQVWQRFRESPADYPALPDRLRDAQPQELFTASDWAWPQVNQTAEERLRGRLLALASVPTSAACAEIAEMEVEHRSRRGTVWAQLGAAPLALALEQLAEVASTSRTHPATSDVGTLLDAYSSEGWKVDRAALRASGEVEQDRDLKAISAALHAVYRPWLDQGARALQRAVGPEANSDTYAARTPPPLLIGGVVVFVDGLRLDVANILKQHLEDGGATVAMSVGLAALPTVTQTAKPALVPIDQSLLGPGEGLDARRASSGATAGVQVLRSLLTDAGVQVLGPQEAGDPSGQAWTETGEIDHKGHSLGARLALEIDDEVSRIARRIRELLATGWSTVTVVTDHGWVLLPSGLPKNEGLPVAATVSKKGRCARVKDGASVDTPTVPWHWDKDVRIAVAQGISSFEANQTYEHGGVSPQECFVPQLMVTSAPATPASRAEITSIKWRGLALVVEFANLPDGAKVDLRSRAGDAGSSIAALARMTGGTGKVILLVEDEDREGKQAQLVIVGADGTLLLQRETTVAKNR